MSKTSGRPTPTGPRSPRRSRVRDVPPSIVGPPKRFAPLPGRTTASVPEDIFTLRMASVAVPGTTPDEERDARAQLRRLETFAQTMGLDRQLKLELGDWWAYSFDTNTITVPYAELRGKDIKYQLAVILHELGHRLYSRVPPSDVIRNPSFHFLWNAVEDIRINKMMCARFAGVRNLMRELYRDQVNPSLRAAGWQRLMEAAGTSVPPRAHQFGHALIYEWAMEHLYGVTGAAIADPTVTTPEVLAALAEARPVVAKATRLPAVSLAHSDLTPSEATAEAIGSFNVIRDDLWPIYERLLRQDVEDATQQNAQPPSSSRGASGAGAGESGQSAEGAGQSGEGAGQSGEGAGQSGQASGQSGQGAGGKPSTGTGEAPTGASAGGAPGGGASSGRASSGAAASDPVLSAGEGAEAEDDEGDGDGDGASTSGAASSEGAGGGDLETENLPSDPLQVPATSEPEEKAKRDLRRIYRREAKKLGSKLRESEAKQAREGKGTDGAGQGQGAQGSGDASASSGEGEASGSSGPQSPQGAKAAKGTKGAQGPQKSASRSEAPVEALEDDDVASFRDAFTRRMEALDVAEAARLSPWDRIRKEDFAVHRGIRRSVERHFQATSRRRPGRTHYRTGPIFDVQKQIQKELKEEATGQPDTTTKTQRRNDRFTARDDLSWEIILDTSISMGGPASLSPSGSGEIPTKADYAERAVVNCEEGLVAARSRTGVIAFDSTPRILKEHGSKPDELTKQAMLSGVHELGGSTNYLPALQLALDELKRRGGRNRFIVMITDGDPTDFGGAEQVRAAIEAIQRDEGVIVIGIGIGESCGAVAEVFPHHVLCPDVTQLGEALDAAVRKVLEEKRTIEERGTRP